MAYNREWDRGKDWNNDSWNDNSWGGNDNSWNEYGSGNYQGRDDGYYGEGKRRKFNNGVRLLILLLKRLSESHLQ